MILNFSFKKVILFTLICVYFNNYAIYLPSLSLKMMGYKWFGPGLNSGKLFDINHNYTIYLNKNVDTLNTLDLIGKYHDHQILTFNHINSCQTSLDYKQGLMLYDTKQLIKMESQITNKNCKHFYDDPFSTYYYINDPLQHKKDLIRFADRELLEMIDLYYPNFTMSEKVISTMGYYYIKYFGTSLTTKATELVFHRHCSYKPNVNLNIFIFNDIEIYVKVGKHIRNQINLV